MAVVGTGRTPASPHPLPPHPHPGERRDPGDGTKAKPGRGGGPRCRERRAVGRGTPGAASPFCGGAQPVTRGPRGRRTGGRTAPGGAPPAAPEVRDKYPPGPSQGRGGVILGPAARLGTCPGRTATCVGGGGGSRRAQFELHSELLSGNQLGTGTRREMERRAGGVRWARAACLCPRKPAPLRIMPGFTASASVSPRKEKATMNHKSEHSATFWH